MATNPDYKMSITARGEDFDRTVELVHHVAVKYGVREEEADVIEMAVGEACENAILYCGDDFEDAKFNLELTINSKRIEAVVTSKGAPFEFDKVEEFNLDQDFMMYKEGGLGIPLMKKLMDEFHYDHLEDSMNVVTLVKNISDLKRDTGENSS